MFPDANDIQNLSKETGLTPNAIFKVLQSRFHPAVSEFLPQVAWPQNYHVDQTALVKMVHCFSFLFSLGIFDRFHQCHNLLDLEMLVASAASDFAEFPGRNWQFFCVCPGIGCTGSDL
jgi:hypothetical protein